MNTSTSITQLFMQIMQYCIYIYICIIHLAFFKSLGSQLDLDGQREHVISAAKSALGVPAHWPRYPAARPGANHIAELINKKTCFPTGWTKIMD